VRHFGTAPSIRWRFLRNRCTFLHSRARQRGAPCRLWSSSCARWSRLWAISAVSYSRSGWSRY
jgi:hypothetical protein